MEDFRMVLNIFLRYNDEAIYAPFHCEHDILYIYPGVKAEDMEESDVIMLDSLGVRPDYEFADEGAWSSHRFGSC